MKITIYELLGMVKDGKAPKKIKVYGKIYINNNCNCYLDEKDKSLCSNVEIPMFLNDEIVILDNLEEEKKKPEKLEEPRFNKGRYYIKDINGDDSEISGIERTFRLKINEIIDYLKSKGE